MKQILCLLLTALFLASCSAETPAEPAVPEIPAAETEAIETAEPAPEETESPEAEPETEALAPVKPAKVEEPVTEEGYLTKSGTRVSAETVEKYPQLTNLPTLYIELPSRTAGLRVVQHGVYSDATYTLVDGDHTNSYYDLPMQIKGRGNYSWSFAQKPYTLKLAEKADLAGMGEAKKWVLVTVHSDKTMLHNYLTQECAAWLGLPGTCDNEYVDVVANGKYAGTYVLTEKIQIHENRIDVVEGKSALFEIEMVYRHDCDLCIVMYENKRDPSNSVHLRLKEYQGKDVEDLASGKRMEAFGKFKTFFDGMKTAILSGSMEELEKYIDVDSFVNWYLLNEITRNYDSKFVTSCYCFMGNDGRLYMGPCWDYDTCYGAQFPDTEGAWIQQAPWYQWLFENHPPFVQAVKDRWKELRQEGSDIVEWFDTNIDATVERIAESEKMNHELFPDSEFVNIKYDAAVAYMKRFLEARFRWMDSEFLGVSGNSALNCGNDATEEIVAKYDNLAQYLDTDSADGPDGNPNEGVLNLFDADQNTKYCLDV
ncbi:MAG: CotH kinase family protein, partial [Lentisphaeria bacterium]|nr:CotH kinase family protein [Lentisphaeria bacterium]